MTSRAITRKGRQQLRRARCANSSPVGQQMIIRARVERPRLDDQRAPHARCTCRFSTADRRATSLAIEPDIRRQLTHSSERRASAQARAPLARNRARRPRESAQPLGRQIAPEPPEYRHACRLSDPWRRDGARHRRGHHGTPCRRVAQPLPWRMRQPHLGRVVESHARRFQPPTELLVIPAVVRELLVEATDAVSDRAADPEVRTCRITELDV